MNAKHLIFALVFLITIGGALAVTYTLDDQSLIIFYNFNETDGGNKTIDYSSTPSGGYNLTHFNNFNYNTTQLTYPNAMIDTGIADRARYYNISQARYSKIDNVSYFDTLDKNNFTLNVWVNYRGSSSALGTIFSPFASSGPSSFASFMLQIDSRKLRIDFVNRTNNAFVEMFYNTTVPIDTWFMVTLRRNDTNISLWYNGAFVASTYAPGSTPINLSRNGFLGYYTGLGARSSDTNGTPNLQPLNGTLDEFGFWNRTLNSSEISYLYGGGSGRRLSDFNATTYDVAISTYGNKTFNISDVHDYFRNLTINITVTCNSDVDVHSFYVLVNDTNVSNGTVQCVAFNTVNAINYINPTFEGNTRIKTYFEGVLLENHIFTSDIYNPSIVYLNFSRTAPGLSTTNTSLYLNCTDSAIGNVSYNLTFNGVNFENNNQSNGTLIKNDTTLISGTNTITGVCTDLFGSTSSSTSGFSNYLNITFYYEPTDTLFQPDVVTAILISNVTNGTNTNGTTTTGNLAFGGIDPAYYEIRYSSPGFVERTYYFTLSEEDANTSNVSLSLYLINTSLASVITITVKNQDLELVNGAEFRFLRYFQDTQTYEVVDETVTANNGQGVVNLVLNDVYYKAIILYQGNVVYETEPFRVTSQALTFIIPLDAGFTVISPIDISSNLTYETAIDGYFQFTYADLSGLSSTGCLEVTSNFFTGNNVLCTTCVTSSSGSMTCAANSSNGTSITARGYVTDSSGNRYLVAVYEKNFSQVAQTFGLVGVFITFIIMLITIFMGIKSPETGLFGCVIGLIASLVFGVVYMTILNIVLLAIAIVIVLSTRGRE